MLQPAAVIDAPPNRYRFHSSADCRKARGAFVEYPNEAGPSAIDQVSVPRASTYNAASERAKAEAHSIVGGVSRGYAGDPVRGHDL
jgi:hypothetical protein